MWVAIKTRFILIVSLVLLLVSVHLINTFFSGSLAQYGVIPRSTDSLWHIFTAPFIHASWTHLWGNLIGISIFSAFCLTRSIRFYVFASIFVITMSGLGVWLFARTASHIGASGWIFGLWSISIAMAIFDRSLKTIVIALIVIFLYGGMIYGLLPNNPDVSFEAHIFGAVAGVICAYFYKLLNANGRQASSSDGEEK